MNAEFRRDVLRDIVSSLIDDKVHRMLESSAGQRYENIQRIQAGKPLEDTSDNAEQVVFSAYLHIKPSLRNVLNRSSKLDFEISAGDLVDVLMEELFDIEDKYLAKLHEKK